MTGVTYVVEFDRIGPRRDIPPLTVIDLAPDDRAELGQLIEDHARTYMAGLTPTAHLDWDAEAGTLTAHRIEVGQFTIGRVP